MQTIPDITAANSNIAATLSAEPFRVSEAAMVRIAYLLQSEPAGSRFWVSVLGGGCSGFQYHFEFSDKVPAETDALIEHQGACVAVDEVSLPLLKGAMLDYVEDLASAGFEIKNPNAVASCGCGNSFSVAF